MGANDGGQPDEKMGANAVWAMAVGGMVGGGIFSVLGVTVHFAGALAWLSFVVAGLIALCTGFSYVHLAAHFGKGGGAFMFLTESGLPRVAGSVAWVLIIGYVLTNSVYAFTFGHYIGEAFGMGPLVTRGLSLAIIAAIAGVNLLGVGEASGVELVAVWGKLAVLVGLAVMGLLAFHPARLSEGVQAGGFTGALIGAASIFMAYEGFQLLAYDYGDIRSPDRMLLRTIPIAVVSVILIYVLVALGTASLVGAGTLVKQKEIALAVAGQAALGTAGKVIVSVAAALSTASAINATLFATARLARQVAQGHQLPAGMARTNRRGIPDRAVIGLGAVSAVLAMAGSLDNLVSAASLIFLLTFAMVNAMGVHRLRGTWRWVALAGATGAIAAAVTLSVRLVETTPLALGGLVLAILAAVFLRPLVLAHTRTS